MEETSPRKRREDQKSIQSNEPKTTSLQKEVRWCWAGLLKPAGRGPGEQAGKVPLTSDC